MDDFIGSIHLWSTSIVPTNWALCDGRLLQISDYQELYSIIGCIYGGDQIRTFALPDLRGRFAFPACEAIAIPPGKTGGASKVALDIAKMPAHKHNLNLTVSQNCSTSGSSNSTSPKDNFQGIASAGGATCYSDTPTSGAYMAPLENTVTEAVSGTSAAHENMPPYLACNYIICLKGYYPAFE